MCQTMLVLIEGKALKDKSSPIQWTSSMSSTIISSASTLCTATNWSTTWTQGKLSSPTRKWILFARPSKSQFRPWRPASGDRRDRSGTDQMRRCWRCGLWLRVVWKGSPLACSIPFCTGLQSRAPIEQSADDSWFYCVSDPASLVVYDRCREWTFSLLDIHWRKREIRRSIYIVYVKRSHQYCMSFPIKI